MKISHDILQYTELEDSIANIDDQIKRLIRKGCRRDITAEERIAIRGELTKFRREKKRLRKANILDDKIPMLI